MGKSLVEMAADLVQAQCSSKGMTTEEIAFSLQSTYKALQVMQAEEVRLAQGVGAEGMSAGIGIVPGVAPQGIGVAPEKSIQKNKIICLECGQEFKMLSPKHLKSHGLTGREYREKYGFSRRQPLCAKSLSDRRKQAGKDRGLPENLKKAIAKRRKGGKKGAAKK